MNRPSSIKFLGVLGLLVGVPVAMTGGDHLSLLHPLVPPVSLSMVRNGPSLSDLPASDLPATLASDSPAQASDSPVVAPEAQRRRLVIEALPAPGVAVSLENVNTEETVTLTIGQTGQVRPEQVALVKHFFRCRRTEREKPIAPATLAMLTEVAQRWPGHVIEIVSGFRAPPYGAPHSKHFAGHAIDLRVRGVRSSAVRDFIWRNHHGVGVGYYTEENFVHMDSRPGERDMAWTGEGEDGIPAYGPRWAYKARHPGRSHARVRSPLASASPSARSL
jgi:uncharacterized protein YcbK (DUF882 family)